MKPSDLNRLYSAANRLNYAIGWLDGIKPGGLTTQEEQKEVENVKQECINLENRLRKLYKKWYEQS